MKKEIEYCPHCGAIPKFSVFANPKNFCFIKCECGCGTDGFKICKVNNTLQENKELNLIAWNRRYKREKGRPERIDKEKIRQLRSENFSYRKIAEQMECSKTYVIKVCKDNQQPL